MKNILWRIFLTVPCLALAPDNNHLAANNHLAPNGKHAALSGYTNHPSGKFRSTSSRESAAATPAATPCRATGLQCSPYNGYGIQHCVAGIESAILDIRASDVQHASEWCWAASISAVFSYYGHPVSQEEIVAQTFGTIVNMPGQPPQILAALNRVWKDDNGNLFRAEGTTVSANPVTAAQDLSADHPLIIGTLGHAMVLTLLEYNHDAAGRGTVTSAVVRDPWPYNARRRILTPQEWFGTTFLARIRVN